MLCLNQHVENLVVPLEVFSTALCYAIVYDTHCLYHLFLHLRSTVNVELRQEVVGNGNQRILWPALEPVHGTARNQSRELQWSCTEFFSNLGKENGITFWNNFLPMTIFAVKTLKYCTIKILWNSYFWSILLQDKFAELSDIITHTHIYVCCVVNFHKNFKHLFFLFLQDSGFVNGCTN